MLAKPFFATLYIKQISKYSPISLADNNTITLSKPMNITISRGKRVVFFSRFFIIFHSITALKMNISLFQSFFYFLAFFISFPSRNIRSRSCFVELVTAKVSLSITCPATIKLTKNESLRGTDEK